MIEMTVDLSLGVAYIRLSNEPVARTCEVTDEIVVDLDVMGVVVGVEVLALDAEIPTTELVDKFHVRAEAITALMKVRPNVTRFLQMQSEAAADSVPHVRTAERVSH